VNFANFADYIKIYYLCRNKYFNLMELIKRNIESQLQKDIFSGKVICVMGARQTGKTTLIKSLTKSVDNLLWLNADEIEVRDLIESASVSKLEVMFGGKDVIVIDEAQRIPDIGIKAKLIIDTFKEKQLILTGSSSLDLSNKINEPLTGRKWEYKLYPFSFGELASHYGAFQETLNLPIRLVYGSYPDVVCHKGDEERTLSTLANSYLYKDVLEWQRIKKPEKILKLLQALAFQVGSNVSYTEIGNMIQLDAETVEKYINLLEQAFVIFRVGSYSRNLRNELKYAKKIYFYDNGIRNAVINNFADISLRQDVGALWENYMVSELKKKSDYSQKNIPVYFWRTTDQKEIDFLQDYQGILTAFEFKWNSAKKGRKLSLFTDAYPNAILTTVTPENYMEVL